MLIDWFTVLAQVVNFLVLVLLLRRFLYQPVLRAVQQRETRIKDQLEEARQALEDARAEKEEYTSKNRALEGRRKDMLGEMEAEARTYRKDLLDEARKEVSAFRERLHEALREEQDAIRSDVARSIQREVLDLSRQVLRDLASASLEEQMIASFLQRLRDLDGEEREALLQALREGDRKVVVRSAFPMSDAGKASVGQILEELREGPVSCSFRVDPDKISGLELQAGGYKIAWSAAEYLDELEKKLEALLVRDQAEHGEPTARSVSHGTE